MKTFSAGISRPDSLALDSAGRLFVANHRTNSIAVFAPRHKNTPRAITKGVHAPLTVISAPSKELFVLNYDNNSVSVYSEATFDLLRVIKTGIACPTTMAMSGTGLL